MHFKQSDLQQLTPEYTASLPPEQRSVLIEQLRKDLIEAQDRLNQNPSNSSKPPSSRAPWERGNNDNTSEEQSEGKSSDENESSDENDLPPDDPSDNNQKEHEEKGKSQSESKEKKRKPGK